MKTARVTATNVVDEKHFKILQEKGFDMDRPFKMEELSHEAAEGEEYFRFTQSEPEDAEKPQAETTCDQNGSGILPVEYKVLIGRPEIEVKTDGGIVIPDAITQKEKMRRVVGTLVAKGGNAFEDWKPPLPKVGDRVRIAKYVGEFFTGADGKAYQLCSDKDISAIITSQWKEEYFPSGQTDYAGDGEFAHLRTKQDPGEIEEKMRKEMRPGTDRIRVFMSK